jgi:hypothetical protein
MLTQETETNNIKRQRNKVISSVKDRLTLSLWWLSIPVYTIAVQYMKTWFLPKTIFRFNIHDLIIRERTATFFLFIILPVIMIIINAFSMIELYKLENNFHNSKSFKLMWANVLEVIIAVVVIRIFFI